MSSPSSDKTVVAVVGVGLVGSEVLDQLYAIPKALSPFRVVAFTSSKKSFYSVEQPEVWRDALEVSSVEFNIHSLTQNLSSLVTAGQKVVIIDNTSSDEIAKRYPGWLKAGINVITPNKKAFSGELSLYKSIVEASAESGARFLHESTVGAGLPVINTLKELVATGDKIIKIEGVFSGTMSYIFNEFSTGNPTGPSFSSVVSTAREKGYTEPHPADDLNGADVARKLTILSRIISFASWGPSHNLPQLESYASVKTESLIPAALEGVATGDEFLQRLPEFDAHFDQMRKSASQENKVLRFVGVVDPVNGEVRAGLEKYPVTHPFATSLGGSDNIIMFHTERYGARPLIVQGAGAGAAVTAMGVFGDLFKLTI